MDEWVHALRRPGETLHAAKQRLEKAGTKLPRPEKSRETESRCGWRSVSMTWVVCSRLRRTRKGDR
jgi:hypothetical protein